MTFEEFLEFLDEYRTLFGPAPIRAPNAVYERMRLCVRGAGTGQAIAPSRDGFAAPLRGPHSGAGRERRKRAVPCT